MDSERWQFWFFRGSTKFHIETTRAILTSDVLYEQVGWTRQRHPISDEIALALCLPILERLAPDTTLRGIALEDFASSQTYHIEILPPDELDDRVHAVVAAQQSEEPAYHLLPISTANIPHVSDAVPRIPASRVMLDPERKDIDNVAVLWGRAVETTSGELYHFKAREDGREREFDRELEILCLLRQLRATGVELRVSELHGIVVSGEHTIGVLIKLISPHTLGMHPLEKGFCGRFELHNKWEDQVRATVHQLHQYDLVWGDVNPCNIIIDKELNAWIIDFGGNYNWEFVDKDNAESEAGDWQGIQKLFGVWLPSCRIWPTGEVGEVQTGDVC